jgi:hypothetical protein
LNGRYTELSGTLYGDDYSSTIKDAFYINDTSDLNYTRPLYGYTATSNQEAIHFTINVRGVQTIQIGSHGGGSGTAYFDLVADLETGGTPPPAYPIPLEQLHLSQASYVSQIPVGNWALHDGVPLNRGFQMRADYGGTQATITLNGRYTELSGTLYGDDYSSTTNDVFYIDDTTYPATPRSL